MASQNKQNCTDFIEQCSLLYDLKKMSTYLKRAQKKYKKTRVKDPLTLIDGDPALFLNQFVYKKHSEEILKITPLQQSMLVPFVRFWKVFYDASGNRREKEFQFKKTKLDMDSPGASYSSVLQSQDGIQQVGVKSVSIEFVGETPAYRDNKIMIKVKLFAKEIGDLFAPPGCAKCAPIAEFISPPPPRVGISQFVDPDTCNKVDIASTSDPDQYEVKMVYGWAPPPPGNDLFSTDMRKAIEATNITVLMVLGWQTIKFSQEGNVTLDIDFAGRLSKVFDAERADIFGLEKKVEKYMNNMRMAVQKGYFSSDLLGEYNETMQDLQDEVTMDAELEKGGDKIDRAASNQIKAINKIFERIISAGIKREQLVSIMRYITDGKDQLIFKKISLSDVHSYIRSVCPDETSIPSAASSRGSSPGGIVAAPTDASAIRGDMERYTRDGDQALRSLDERSGFGSDQPVEDQSISTMPEEINSLIRDIPVIFFADLIDAALQNIQPMVPYNKLNYRVILGPLSYIDPQTKKKWNINIGDIPITVHEISHWYNDNFVKQDRQILTFFDFMTSIVYDLLLPILKNKCHRQLRKVFGSDDFNVGMTQVSVAATDSGKDPLEGKDRINILDFKGSTYSPHVFVEPKNKKIKGTYDYFVIYASNVSLTHLDGSPKQNKKNKIVNLSLGADRGIVKKIQFQQVTNEKLKTHFLMSKGSPFERLKIPYNAQPVELMGNSLFYPGSHVYISPSVRGLGDPRNPASAAVRLGLGGYYLVTQTNHNLTFEPGGSDYVTTFDAYHQGWPQNCKAPMSTPANIALPDLPDIDGPPAALNSIGEVKAARTPFTSGKKETPASKANESRIGVAWNSWSGASEDIDARDGSQPPERQMPEPSAGQDTDMIVLSEFPHTTTNYYGLEPPATMHVPTPYFNIDPRANREFRPPGSGDMDFTAHRLPPRVPATCKRTARVLSESLLSWLRSKYPHRGGVIEEFSFYSDLAARGYALEKPMYIREDAIDFPTPRAMTRVSAAPVTNQESIHRATFMMKEKNHPSHHVYFCCRNDLYGWFIYNYMVY